MPYQTPSLDGQPIFGLITEFVPEPIEAVVQESAFFGQNGKLAKWGGTRGYHFHIKGVFQEFNIALINLDLQAVLAFQGPALHVLVDTSGNTWPNVLFRGKIVPAPRAFVTPTGWSREYTMELESLL